MREGETERGRDRERETDGGGARGITGEMTGRQREGESERGETERGEIARETGGQREGDTERGRDRGRGDRERGRERETKRRRQRESGAVISPLEMNVIDLVLLSHLLIIAEVIGASVARVDCRIHQSHLGILDTPSRQIRSPRVQTGPGKTRGTSRGSP